MVAVPAMFSPGLVVHLATVERVGCRFQKIFNEVDCVIEKIVVGFTAINVDLSFQLSA